MSELYVRHHGIALKWTSTVPLLVSVGDYYVGHLSSPRHKHWPAGPAHFLDRRTSSGQYIWSFTGLYGPPRYMSGHQISNSAGPNDDESQYILFARAPVPHLGSCRAVLLLQPDASMARVGVGVGHVNQTHWRQCLDHAAHDFNANIRDASGHFSPQSTWKEGRKEGNLLFCKVYINWWYLQYNNFSLGDHTKTAVRSLSWWPPQYKNTDTT